MTREEAINVMQKYTDTDSGISKVVAEAHEMAISALEQEPCDDAISRADAISAIVNADNAQDEIDSIRALPPVTPSRRKGHWIETEYHRYRCPICREKGMSDWDNIHDKKTDFCPNCGAEMESEDADSN